ncbi:alkaline phosphatase D family protein [Bradyrhizobium iriomotense]|uniref:alkaline phosphatase D family protein n=1 Tax=Bradyrhizobium iriomotense TaxID=441950 RepID=UPI001B8A4AF1|nr:alkaline phosphatase D family protein [Bradyrhizobium iriomotense]MBR1133276.1 alkaline phosphatase D family protein [Bradyrhizobium iriomotense]
MTGAPDLYRYNTYGSDAAIILTDERSFRDAGLPGPTNPLDPTQISQFLTASFDPSRTILGDVQFARVEHDLLDARDNGVTWKFVMVPEPIQNFGPVLGPGDRFEAYAAERDALLKFIADNHIENVVFVSADQHWTSPDLSRDAWRSTGQERRVRGRGHGCGCRLVRSTSARGRASARPDHPTAVRVV